MREHFTIWIVSPEGLVWSHVFDEVALGLQSAFRDLGYAAAIVTDAKDIVGTALVLGANLAPMAKISLPRNAIIYNLEQVHERSRWFAPEYGYGELLKRHSVWDFSLRNIEALEALGVGPVVHCPIGYADELTRITQGKQDVDVLFIGGEHPRRDVVLDEVRKGARVEVLNKVFGQERDGWIGRSKIHLNIHKEAAEIFEVVRVSHLLANKCFVVSEVGRDKAMEAALAGGVVFAAYEKLGQTCMDYLVKPKERKAIAEAGFELFRAMPQRGFLDKALTEYAQMKRVRVAKNDTADKRIFVAVASYRDTEIQPTLSDLFRRAARPERLRVGVCLQVAEGDADCEVDEGRFAGQVKVMRVSHTQSRGANWARVQALSFKEDEAYVLMIDSHMRFIDGWDDALVDLLAACPAEKPVISSYVPNYEPPNQLFFHPEQVLRVKVKKLGGIKDSQLVHVSGEMVMDKDPERGGLYPTPIPVANFIFARAGMLAEVPLDPDIHFWGDEINYAARLWTHGYDIFQLDRVVAFHYWLRKDALHLHDYREPKSEANKVSAQRLRRLLAGEDIGQFGLGHARRLDDLWEFAGIDWAKLCLSEWAEKGIWNMAARERGRKAAKVESLPRIYVQIASYRDPQCQWTVKDLFAKAAHPERITVGICWQFMKGADDICFTEPYPFPEQVRVHEVDAGDSLGVCWARGLTQKMWQGEEFTMQIDSHMRFEQGWDEMMLSMWKQCEDENAVLTCYPPGFTPPDTLDKRWIFGMSAKEFDGHGIFLMKGSPAYNVPRDLPAQPMAGAFVSANTLFGPSRIITDVPYDPYLYFFGEEITMAVRLWTHGYNLYHPNQLVIYHDWNRDKRPTHFSDHKDWTVQNDKSFARVRHMLGTQHCTDAALLAELDVYGLGEARSLEEYQAYSGVNFAAKTFTADAEKGKFERLGGAKQLTTIRMGEEKVKAAGDGRIFVNIASYRDPECQWTVKDLFEKANNPDRIFVGICWQFDAEEDKHCFEVTTREEQVRISPIDWREAEGVCWARNQAQMLWEGEEFTLMIDSHMRFMQGWDDDLIAELAKCDAEKPLLSMSPVGYLPPNKLGTRLNPTIRRAKPFMADGNIRCQGEMLDVAPPSPLKGAFLVANFMFSRSEVTAEVPYDPYLYFDQEEISYAARLYTHGWDVFSPTRQFLYHYYNDHSAPGGSVRHLHWRDLHKEDTARIKFLRERGLKRFNHMTGYQRSQDEAVLAEMAKFGFGRVRTLAEYEAFSGVDFKRKVASERALYCQFIENLQLYRQRPIVIAELEGRKQEMAVGQGGGSAGPVISQVAKREFAPVSQPLLTPVNQMLLTPKVAATAVKMLEAGDFMPLFEAHDTEKRLRTMEALAGRFVVMLYIPAGKQEMGAGFYHEVKGKLEAAGLLEGTAQVLITDDTMERGEKFRAGFNISAPVWLDADRRIARSLGMMKPGEAPPFGAFVLDRNLKIAQVRVQADVTSLAGKVLQDLSEAMARHKEHYPKGQVIRYAAPALMVPDVFSPEFCAKCIQAFRNGKTFDGTVGARENKIYRADVKIRTDFIVHGELLEEIDDKFSRSFFPEIKKVFGFDVTHREMYKIGLYTGDKGGFFKQHRDNFDYPMAYRRIASTVHLNDDYEGGGVRFPEYGDDVYRPPVGGAVAFSGATVHEALPVTKGERFILVAFVHGQEEEAYRRHFVTSRNEPVKPENYIIKPRQHPELRQSRWFYKDWQEKNIRYDGAQAQGQKAPDSLPAAANVNQRTATPTVGSPNIMIGQGQHKPVKVHDSKGGIIFDNFLPDDVYQRLYKWVRMADYEYINTHGKITRAWHIHDGFPLRSSQNFFYHAKYKEPQKPEHIYPLKNDVDAFMEAIVRIGPQIEHLIGKPDEQWAHFSVTAWLYPHGTGLALHDDGSGVYAGAYTFFMNPTWRAHWGGLLLLIDDEANQMIHEHRSKGDQYEFYKQKFLHANELDNLILEHGMAKCILPKGNRIVFIANDAYHMITRVNEQSGDNLRTSLAGFFNRKK